MKILAIDTSCDETAAAVTEDTRVLSNVIWSQASEHAKWGGVVPSLAQRMHEERIDWVVERALKMAKCTTRLPDGQVKNVQMIAITEGPGLAIALGVGIKKARELGEKWKIPVVGINHVEGHLLSPLAAPTTSPQSLPCRQAGLSFFPSLGLVVSGGHTELVLIEKIGKYKILAQTQDDALGEALDKAARMLGLGYPGGALLEKMARNGDIKAYPLPLPMAGRENLNQFSYSGLKAAMWRLVQEIENNPTSHKASLGAREICNLAAGFQNMAFRHLTRVCKNTILSLQTSPLSPLLNLGEGLPRILLVGGGVAANVELRKRLRALGKELGLKVLFPYSKKLTGDNAAMIGVVAGLRQNAQCKISNEQLVDRRPRWSVEEITGSTDSSTLS
jgi:N6-L-threonylcarbamoyladenine synthase